MAKTKTMTPADKKAALANHAAAVKAHKAAIKAIDVTMKAAAGELKQAKKAYDDAVKSADKTYKAAQATHFAVTKKAVAQVDAAAKGTAKLDAQKAALEAIPTEKAPKAEKTAKVVPITKGVKNQGKAETQQAAA